MTEKIVLDTTIAEPSLTAGEVDLLFFALDRARAQFAWKVGGLDTGQLRLLHPPSTTTLGGLIKHLAQVEDSYISRFLTGQPLGEPWNAAGEEAIWEWAYRTAADDSAEELYMLWQGAVERSRAAWADVLATGELDQLSTFGIPSGSARTYAGPWSTRSRNTSGTPDRPTSCARRSTDWSATTRRNRGQLLAQICR